MTLTIIADDLTGANDAAAEFIPAGFQVTTLLDPAELRNFQGEHKVVALDTETRELKTDQAREKLQPIVAELSALRPKRLLKKIDTAFRGNVVTEIEVLLSTLKLGCAFVVAAIPSLRRITVGGYQLIDGQPIEKIESLRTDALPRGYSHLPSLLSKTSRLTVGHLPLSTVMQGPEAIDHEIKRLLKDGTRLVVMDAVCVADLAAIGQVLIDYWEGNLVVGSVGVAHGLAKGLGTKKTTRANPKIALQGYILVVVGTPHEASQIQALKMLETKKVTTYSGQIKNGDMLLCASKQLDDRERHTSVELAKKVRKIAQEKPFGGLILTGGSTAYHVLYELGARGLKIEAILSQAIIVGSLMVGPWEGLPIITKGGSVGGENALMKALDYLKGGKQ